LDNHDPKRAEELLSAARRHHWSSAELDQLEAAGVKGVATVPLKEAAAH
jgi:hypothetical protein